MGGAFSSPSSPAPAPAPAPAAAAAAPRVQPEPEATSPASVMEALRLAEARALEQLIRLRGEAQEEISRHKVQCATLEEKFTKVRGDFFRLRDEAGEEASRRTLQDTALEVNVDIVNAHERAWIEGQMKLLEAKMKLELVVQAIVVMERRARFFVDDAVKLEVERRLAAEREEEAASWRITDPPEPRNSESARQRELEKANQEKLRAAAAQKAAEQQREMDAAVRERIEEIRKARKAAEDEQARPAE